jgi:tripartite-type tricarboxylate transporter receptor subunit TctC
MIHRRSLLATPALLPLAAAAQPVGSITILVGFAPGGIGDALMRVLAEQLRQSRGAQVIVENRPGAAGTLANERAAHAAPDGRTVALYSPSTVWIVPQLQRVGYDPLTDLTPLGQICTQPMPVYVKADSRFGSWDAVLTHLRSKPGDFSWGTAGSRSMAEITVEAAFRQLGLQTTSVPFRGGAEAITALLGGHVDAVASTDFGPLLRQNAVRLLVETGPVPAVGQDIPTFAQLGYPLHAAVAYGVVAPAGMPAPMQSWWDAAIRDASASPAMAELMERWFGRVAHVGLAELAPPFREGYEAFGRALR